MKSKQSKRIKKRLSKHLEQINLFAAGIDVGSESHYVAIPEGLDDEPVRCFSCYTSGLEALADWLVQIGIQTVAMESTGVYWIPLFEILEERGLEVLLVNARHIKNVDGRKTDVLDCQWIQQLHTYGLLKGAFRPAEEVASFRAYMRHRSNMVRYAGIHIQHMQKALRQMNLLLDNVVTDITGVTGMAIIRSILSGERNPDQLASHRDGRCKKSVEEIAQSLRGHYREEHLFALRQSLQLYETCRAQVSECDIELEKLLQQFSPQGERDTLSEQKSRKSRKSKSCPDFDVRKELHRMSGVDLTSIDGISDITALTVISEIGTDMSRWGNEKQFSCWMGLSPGSKISGGKILSSKTKPTANRAAGALRMAALGLANSKSALGAYYRRLRGRLGAPKAITATAHKLARIIYSMLKYGKEYVDEGQDYYEQKYQARVVKNLKRTAKQMGFTLTALPDATEAT